MPQDQPQPTPKPSKVSNSRVESSSANHPQGEVGLSPPWNISSVQCYKKIYGSANKMTGYEGKEASEFVIERSRVHEAYIVQKEKTNRLKIVVGSILFAVACSLIVFAPEGKEVVSYAISAVLIIVAGGTFGYNKVWGKFRKHGVGAQS